MADAQTPVPLPPAQLPPPGAAEVGPVTLRPLTLADNAAAFVLSEVAFLPEGRGTMEEDAARQQRWDASGRQWFGWLHAQSGGHAWAATRGDGGPLIGYARVIRDPVARREQLTELFVHPHYQGGQVGKALLGAVMPQTIPDGWGRVIIADPSFPALALYHRWGMYPLGVAWRARIALPITEIEHESHENPRKTRNDADDGEAGGMLRHFMQRALGAQVRFSAAGGYGVRYADMLGPVIGTTSADALALVLASLVDAQKEGHRAIHLWVPGANIALLRWLRERQPRWDAQVALLASDPALVAHLDRALLVAPPYLW